MELPAAFALLGSTVNRSKARFWQKVAVVSRSRIASPSLVNWNRSAGYRFCKTAFGFVKNYNFQVNLRGIIDLLANHLYSSPQVFLRELLQNGVDAIRARRGNEANLQGNIEIETIAGNPPTLIFADNGIGLTEGEIHQFLATIGQSSKRNDLLQARNDYLGQFGIGLLSCFMVSEEIAVVTRSAKSPANQAIEWRGRSDGTYALRVLERPAKVGTQIFLRAKPGCEAYFEGDRLLQLTQYYGGLLPDPIGVTADGTRQIANATPPPWRREFASAAARREALLAHGRRLFGMEFFDCIPLRAGMGGIEGVAYILPQAPSLASKPTHRVYLKNMLLSERVTDLLPDWAFFVKCVINAEDLRPTASREAFYEDATLAAARGLLGQCLRDYLLDLAQRDRAHLEELIALHYLAIKGLAAADDEFYELFIDWLPFETSLGRMTMAECRQQPQLYYAPTLDSFRQISQVAAAQSLCVINGGYTYDLALVERLPRVFPDLAVQCIDAATLVQNFTDLTSEQREATAGFVRLATEVLQDYQCGAQIRKFAPSELPALYTANDGTNLQRSLQQSREIANPHFATILDNLSDTLEGEPHAQLCFNLDNPLVAKLASLPEGDLPRLAIQMLYVQALLLGHHPLNAREMSLLNTGLLGLIELGINP